MKKKLFYVIACLVLVAALNIPVFAYTATISRADLGDIGSAWLSAHSSEVYADTTADSEGIAYENINDDKFYNWVEVELFVNGERIDLVLNEGHQMLTAYILYEGDVSLAQAMHRMRRTDVYEYASTEATP